ncbi:unnamed protein product [Nezara viridula]|uniref:Uncharacterized protein n=1 Tax=Nezara viridula TaxID=85310 RepID=A0A9P0H0N5_NEZVI|nr:unnamed protein product [Nezara viridula]
MMLNGLVAHMKLKRAMLRPLLIKIPPNQVQRNRYAYNAILTHRSYKIFLIPEGVSWYADNTKERPFPPHPAQVLQYLVWAAKEDPVQNLKLETRKHVPKNKRTWTDALPFSELPTSRLHRE